jgi:NADP-dependent 3-hydroxy acid dehydrogenase YdfG
MPRFPGHPPRRPALVTGTSSGIGAATATALAAAGHPVAVGARRVEKCEELAAAVSAGGGEAFAYPLDVADDASVEKFVAAATEALGPPEVVVAGAGRLVPGLVHATSPAAFAEQLQVNLVGAQRLVAAVVPGMVERRRGDVVLVSSDVVRAPRPRMGGYVPGKCGLEGLAAVLRMELEGTGVRVSAVRPGPTVTGMGMDWDGPTTEAVLADWARWGLARHAGFLRAADVAAAVAAVVSAPRGVHLTLVEVQPEAPLTAEAGR